MPKCIDCGRWLVEGKPCICEVEDGYCKECGVRGYDGLCPDCSDKLYDWQAEILEDTND